MRHTDRALLPALLIMILPACAWAKVMNRPCADCHTMHNSQNDQPMAIYGQSNPGLLQFDCVG